MFLPWRSHSFRGTPNLLLALFGESQRLTLSQNEIDVKYTLQTSQPFVLQWVYR